jgi:hypothetical protein
MYVCTRQMSNILYADNQSLSVIVFIEGLRARRVYWYKQPLHIYILVLYL